jgi:glutathione peroxidase
MNLDRVFVVAALVGTLGCSAEAKEPSTSTTPAATAAAAKPLEGSVTDIDGKAVDLKSYRGSALLIVNVASECGYTPQYAELQSTYAKYKDRGLVVLGFPSNDHGGQEPNDGAAIKKFASEEYGVTFPLMAKVHTTGAEIAPLYKTLTAQKGAVKWNFTKFLVDKDGGVVAKFDSAVAPQSPEFVKALEAILPR